MTMCRSGSINVAWKDETANLTNLEGVFSLFQEPGFAVCDQMTGNDKNDSKKLEAALKHLISCAPRFYRDGKIADVRLSELLSRISNSVKEKQMLHNTE